MGVMECDREGCESIMCRRIILDNQYICDSCYEELLEYKRSWPSHMTKDRVRLLIEHFMASRSAPIPLDEEGIDAEFARLTGDGEP